MPGRTHADSRSTRCPITRGEVPTMRDPMQSGNHVRTKTVVRHSWRHIRGNLRLPGQSFGVGEQESHREPRGVAFSRRKRDLKFCSGGATTGSTKTIRYMAFSRCPRNRSRGRRWYTAEPSFRAPGGGGLNESDTNMPRTAGQGFLNACLEA